MSDIERPVTLNAAGLCLEAWRASGDKKRWSTELAGHLADHIRSAGILQDMVRDYRSGWDESSVGIEPVTIEDILKAVEAL